MSLGKVEKLNREEVKKRTVKIQKYKSGVWIRLPKELVEDLHITDGEATLVWRPGKKSFEVVLR